MKKTVGSADKIIRYIIAIIAIYVAYTGMVSSPWNYILYVVAAIMIVTALTGFCGLYSVFGINTCKLKEK
jgi:hypothetical protein